MVKGIASGFYVELVEPRSPMTVSIGLLASSRSAREPRDRGGPASQCAVNHDLTAWFVMRDDPVELRERMTLVRPHRTGGAYGPPVTDTLMIALVQQQTEPPPPLPE